MLESNPSGDRVLPRNMCGAGRGVVQHHCFLGRTRAVNSGGLGVGPQHCDRHFIGLEVFDSISIFVISPLSVSRR
jgi:hypothetical protein